MKEMKPEQLLTLIANAVSQHGCRIVDIDLEQRIINIDGPDAARSNCARALAEILD